NDAVIFVDGDLDIKVLAGTGAIFVTGETRFLLPIILTGSNRITLFSEGDIDLGVAATIQGVLLTHGNVTSGAALILQGAIYASNATDATRGNVTLNGLANFITHDQASTAFASF